MFWGVLLLVMLIPIHLLLRPDYIVGDSPLTDDGYYAFTVARNIALGKGVTIDGSMLTNGFQPLFTFLTVPAFFIAGEDRYIAIRYILLLSWVIYIGTAYLLGKISADIAKNYTDNVSKPFWITSFLYLISSFVFLQHFNGLETGFLLFIYAGTWRYYQLGYHEKSRLGLIGLGVLLGLVVLTRIDTLFFVIILSVYLLLMVQGQSLTLTLPTRISRFALVSGVAFVVSLPWWLYNYLWFGSIIPTSGRSQQEWIISLGRFKSAVYALVTVAFPMIPFSYIGSVVSRTLEMAIQIGCILAIVGFVVWKRQVLAKTFATLWRTDSSRRVVEFGLCLLAAVGVLVVWYGVSSFATYFYARYFAPLALVAILAISALLYGLSLRYPNTTTLVCIMLAIPAFALVPVRFLGLSSGSPHYNEQLILVNTHVPPDEYVAAFESGTLGYFRDKIVNLDGKVNPEAQAIRAQGGNLLRDYLEQRNIHWYTGYVLGKDHPYFEERWEIVGEKPTYGLYYIHKYR
jgi:4-amino-4-deoxy-L-arabinose transferase-like glycosyltransferase